MHPVSSGGISRFQKLLITALDKKYVDIFIDIMAGQDVIKRDSLKDLTSEKVKIIKIETFGSEKVDLKKLEEVKKRNKISLFLRNFLKDSKLIYKSYFYFKHKVFKVDLPWYKFEFPPTLIKKLDDYDLIYLPSPFFVSPFEVKKPVVSTVHDYNWKHNFEGNFNQEMIDLLEKQMENWFKIFKIAISSTRFIQEEQKKYYPKTKALRRVVYLSNFNNSLASSLDISSVKNKYNLENKYVIYPGRLSTHKNVLNLIKIFSVLKKTYKHFKPLVITGLQSDAISRDYSKLPKNSYLWQINKFMATSNLKLNKDIICLGYVSDKEIDALIKGASLVVSSSLYEAGSGPGLDAWNAQVPIAFSNIPSHLEQLDFLGTKAWVFNPKDPEDIARVIKEALDNPEKSKQMAKESKEAIDKYTWDNVAEGYYKVFKEAIEK